MSFARIGTAEVISTEAMEQIKLRSPRAMVCFGAGFLPQRHSGWGCAAGCFSCHNRQWHFGTAAAARALQRQFGTAAKQQFRLVEWTVIMAV